MANANAHPFERVLAALTELGHRVQMRGENQARSLCPAHHDVRPSLGVTRKPDQVLVHCFAGCKQHRVVQALGLRMADLFVASGTPRGKREVVAVYPYCDADGVLIAEKVRRPPKDFRWRRPDPANPAKWLPGLGGLKLGLYRIRDVRGRQRVFCVEGEKDTDRLRAAGLPTVCSPSGVSTWKPEWSEALRQAGCHELVVIPDADRPGREYAERVAGAWFELTKGNPGFGVRVVALPGLSCGEDASDWFDQGHDVPELFQLVHEAPWWAPGAAERARAERRRTLTRERVRRLRGRQREQAEAQLAVYPRITACVTKGAAPVTQ